MNLIKYKLIAIFNTQGFRWCNIDVKKYEKNEYSEINHGLLYTTIDCILFDFTIMNYRINIIQWWYTWCMYNIMISDIHEFSVINKL